MATRIGRPFVEPRSDMDNPPYFAHPRPNEMLAAVAPNVPLNRASTAKQRWPILVVRRDPCFNHTQSNISPAISATQQYTHRRPSDTEHVLAKLPVHVRGLAQCGYQVLQGKLLPVIAKIWQLRGIADLCKQLPRDVLDVQGTRLTVHQ